jgi:hypothetical protein
MTQTQYENAKVVQAKIDTLEYNEEVIVKPKNTNGVRPPAFWGRFIKIEDTEIYSLDGHPYPPKILLFAQQVNKDKTKIVRIANFLIEEIKSI